MHRLSMSNTAPVLVVGFNRPKHLKTLLESIALSPPRILLIALDGPRAGNALDQILVRECQEVIEQIPIKSKIELRIRSNNLGLKDSIVDAVNWACGKYGRVIVLEDDVQVGPNLFRFLNYCLNCFEGIDEIAHINGYNLVPQSALTHPTDIFRTSRFIESYAWATWDRAWKTYDDSLSWGSNVSLQELANFTGGYVSAIKWKMNFADALSGRIDTWAYRWMASIWSQRKLIVSPNSNLINYLGQTSGTHTTLKYRWQELPISMHSLDFTSMNLPSEIDKAADKWLSREVFDESLWGILKGLAISNVLRFSK